MNTTTLLCSSVLLAVTATSVVLPASPAACPAAATSPETQDPLGGGGFTNRVLLESSFAGWTSPLAFAPLVNFGAGLSGFVVGNCGNPAPGMQVTCTAPAGATAGRVLLSAASWNPNDGCPDCPVTTVSMSLQHINAGTVAPGQLVWPAIVQGGTLYVGPSAPAFAIAWTPIAWNSLPAASFCAVSGANAAGLITACGTNPDFACTAMPLSFGFVVTVSSVVPTTRAHCYDDFKVVLECPAQFSTFCTGCVNCGAFPPAIGYAGGLPRIGNAAFSITESGVCPSVPTILIVGTSNTTWSGGTLPTNLAFLGYPACNLCVSPEVLLVAMSTATGTASIPIPIVNDPYLIGQVFYAQWLDFGPPPIGMSDAAKVLIGK